MKKYINNYGIKVYVVYVFVSFLMFGLPLILFQLNLGFIGILWFIFFSGPTLYYLIDEMV